jgi:type IV pilus assembly protein PilA
MKSTKCFECGFVGWSDGGNCKTCGAPLLQREFARTQPLQQTHNASWHQADEGQRKGLAIFSLVLGIISFFTFGLLGVGALIGIIVAVIAMGKVKRDPWRYGGRGMAIAGLALNITSLATVVPIGIIAAIAIPNLLAARMAANEGSAIHSLRVISDAEATYQHNFQRYATLDELAASDLIDDKLASGSKNGYRFTVELTSESSEDGFTVVGVPMTYRSSGRRSFYTDESLVIRAADNHGGPSTRFDSPLASDYEYPRLVPNRENRRQFGY